MNNDADEKSIEQEENTFSFVENVDETENEVEEPQEMESQEEAPDDKPNKENPDRFEFWQSKFTKEQQEREKLAQKLEQYESKFGEVDKVVTELKGRIPEPQEELPPQKPQGSYEDNPIEWIEYQNKLIDHQAKEFNELKSSIQQERQMSQKEKEAQQYKSYMIGEYIKAGVDPQEAQKIFDTLSKPETFDPKNQVAFYQSLMGQNKSEPKPKKKIDNAPPPPGVTPSEAEDTSESDFGVDLLNYEKQTRIY